jgi:hypothetical protein
MHYYLDQAKQKKHSQHSSRALFFKLSMTMGLLYTSFFMLEPAFCKANVYKQVNSAGQIEYSDQPSEESTEMVLPNIQVNSKADLPLQSASQQTSSEVPNNQKQEQVAIKITSPTDQQTFVSPVTEIPVTFEVQPALKPNQKIKLLLDNQPYGTPQGDTGNFVLKNVERGAHELKALVLEDSDQILATSAPIIFYQQRQIVRKNRP